MPYGSFLFLGILALVLAGPARANEEPPPDPETQTVITSDELELVQTEEGNQFIFEGNVRIRSSNLFASCERMEVITGGEKVEQGFGNFGHIRRISAIGNVVIQQADREAKAGRATILPMEGKVILEENPVVRDSRGMVTGYRMILYQGDRRVTIEQGPEGQQPKVVLPSLENLGYETEESEEP